LLPLLRTAAAAALVQAPAAWAGYAVGELSLDDVAARMRYWREVAPGAEALRDAKDSRKYLLVEQDGAGMNNKRIGWEMAGLVALHSGRVLVLPPNSVWWMIDVNGTTSKTEDFINLEQLRGGLPVLTFQEFARKERQALELPAWTVQDTFEGNQLKDWQDYALGHFKSPGKTHAEWCELSSYRSDATVIYANHYPEGRFLDCEKWFELGQPQFTEDANPWQVPNSAYSLLRNHFVWHKDVFDLAAPIVQQLGLFGYVALHARFNDFKDFDPAAVQPAEGILSKWAETPMSGGALLQRSGRVGSSSLLSAKRSMARAHRVLNRIMHWVTPGSVLYVSTDETDEHFLRAFRQRGIDARWSHDFFEKADSPIADIIRRDPVRANKLRGPVEQAVCAFGRLFLGTSKSTFSAYITRMRIYADAPQTGLKEETRLFHTMTPTPEVAKAVQEEIDAWQARGGMTTVDKSSPGAF